MKSKIFAGILGILFIVLSLGLVAGLSLTKLPVAQDLTQFDNYSSFILETDGKADISVGAAQYIEDNSGNIVNLTISPSSYTNVTTAEFNVIATEKTTDALDRFDLGKYSKTFIFTATNVSNVNDTETGDVKINFEKTFCNYKNLANLKIDDLKLDVEKGFGDDEEWYPLDDVEIEFELDARNLDVEEIEDIEIEIEIYDDEGNFIIDERDMDLSDDDFDLEDGDRETITATFKIDPDDLIVENEDYTINIKSTGKIKDEGNLDEELTCVSDSEKVKINIDRDFVVLDNIRMPETVECGEEFQITADVWNIGEDDQEDVYVVILNQELEILEEVEVGDVDSFDKERISTFLTISKDSIPEDVDSKTYRIEFRVYDEDNDLFENDEDDESIFSELLTIKCEQEPVKDVSISASLESDSEDVKEGKEVIIKSTITNTGEEETEYIIGLEGYGEFGNVENINPSSLILNPEESGEVLITLNLNSDSEGEQVFDITATFNGQKVSRPVQLTVSPGFSSAILEGFQDNWFIWVIVLINVILIVAIIIVAVRMSR